MTRLQYAVLRKAIEAVKGARIESVSRIVGVKSVATCLNAIKSRFVARAIKDL